MTVTWQADSSSTILSRLAERAAAIVRLVGAEPEIVLSKIASAAAILALAWIVARVARRVTAQYEKRLAGETEDTLEHSAQRTRTVIQLINSVLTAAISVTTLLLLLNLFIPIGPLLAGIGVFGLALSFGAQSLVKDIISGFFILAENQFSVGDYIEIDGTSGTVERITLRVVMLRDIEGVLHVIPNGSITMVSNRTSGWARVVLDVSVAYRENADHVMDVLRRLLDEFHRDPTWQARFLDAPRVLGVQDLGDSAVNVRVMADTYPGKQWEVKRELRRRVKARFDELGIEIPFPQRTVHLGQDGSADQG